MSYKKLQIKQNILYKKMMESKDEYEKDMYMESLQRISSKIIPYKILFRKKLYQQFYYKDNLPCEIINIISSFGENIVDKLALDKLNEEISF